MSRSERFIGLSDTELARLRQAKEAAEQFDRDRLELLRAALKRVKKSDLVEIMLRIARQDKESQWMLEDEVTLRSRSPFLSTTLRWPSLWLPKLTNCD